MVWPNSPEFFFSASAWNVVTFEYQVFVSASAWNIVTSAWNGDGIQSGSGNEKLASLARPYFPNVDRPTATECHRLGWLGWLVGWRSKRFVSAERSMVSESHVARPSFQGLYRLSMVTESIQSMILLTTEILLCVSLDQQTQKTQCGVTRLRLRRVMW